MSHSENNKRIAKNTLMLYFRQILIMLVSLYTVRVVLEALGVQDYGIYNVVAGVVTMFGFLSHSMAASCQRFFSFELGLKDSEQLKRMFGISIIVFIFIAVLILLLAETIGLWFVYNKLVIPLERRIAAIRVYQFSVFSFVFSLLSSPYMAMIIAREDMNIYAYVSIVEVFLKLAIAFVLRFIAMDKLLLYGFFVLIATIATTAVYGIISVKRYKECRTFFCWNKDLIGKMLSFSLWNMFGSSVSIFKNQIINIMLNQFFNPIVIAARSIAMNVDSAVMSLSNNFSTAIRPQIIKYYASEQREKMLLLVFRGAKCTYLLLYVFFLPLMLELPQVLEIWLKNPPEYTVVFTRLMLIDVLITSISYPLMTASQATGKIKLYQAVVGGLLLLNVPVSLLVLSFGTPPQSVLVVAIVIALIATIARLIIVRQLIDFSISQYLLKVILPIIVISIVSSIPSILIYFLLDKSFLRLCFVTVVSIFSICILSYYIALNKSERLKLKEIVSNYIHPRKVQK